MSRKDKSRMARITAAVVLACAGKVYAAGIPVIDIQANETLGGGFKAVTDNITNLGSQIDRSISSNTDVLVAQLKGLPLTIEKYQAAVQYDPGVAVIPAGRCSFVERAGTISEIEKVVKEQVKEELASYRNRGQETYNSNEQVASALTVAKELSKVATEGLGDGELAPTIVGAQDETLTDEEVAALKSKWEFAVMPVRSSIPSEEMESGIVTNEQLSREYISSQTQVERLELASQVGAEILTRRSTMVPIDTVEEYYRNFPDMDGVGEVSLANLDKTLATYRLQSNDWLRCVNSDCSEKELIAELALMNAQRLELEYRQQHGLEMQNLLLSMVLSSLEEMRDASLRSARD